MKRKARYICILSQNMHPKPIPNLSVHSQPGIKIILSGPISIYLGILMLDPSNTTVVGGCIPSQIGRGSHGGAQPPGLISLQGIRLVDKLSGPRAANVIRLEAAA